MQRRTIAPIDGFQNKPDRPKAVAGRYRIARRETGFFRAVRSNANRDPPHTHTTETDTHIKSTTNLLAKLCATKPRTKEKKHLKNNRRKERNATTHTHTHTRSRQILYTHITSEATDNRQQQHIALL